LPGLGFETVIWRDRPGPRNRPRGFAHAS
jgi:hypothetical protein